MKLSEVHEDMERYLENDCYCPNEIYDVSGFFYQLFPPETEVVLVIQNDRHTVVVDATEGVAKPQCLFFWHDDGSGRILDAQRVDATPNNVGILRDIAQGVKPDGRKLDEFDEGSAKRALKKVLSMCDLVMVS